MQTRKYALWLWIWIMWHTYRRLGTMNSNKYKIKTFDIFIAYHKFKIITGGMVENEILFILAA